MSICTPVEAAQRAYETFTNSLKGREGRTGDGFEDARMRPSLRMLMRAVEQLYLATLATEEGRPCRPRMVYVHPHRLDSLPMYRLGPRDLTASEIRQLCFSHGTGGALVWTLDSDVTTAEIPRIVAILPDCDLSRLTHWVIEGPANGGVDIWAGLDRLVSLRAGSMEVMRRHARSTLEHLGPEIGWFFGETDLANDWNEVVARIIASGHGGSLWVCKSRPASDAMITLGYPIASITAFGEPAGAGELGPGVVRIAQPVHLRLTSVAELANLDGAVLLNHRMEPFGFGAFIATDPSDQVFKLNAQREPKLVPSAITGGGRHRAAVSFCRACAPALAIVVSSDGSVTMVSHRPGAPAPVSMTYSQVKGDSNAIALRKQYELGPTGVLEPEHIRQNVLKT